MPRRPQLTPRASAPTTVDTTQLIDQVRSLLTESQTLALRIATFNTIAVALQAHLEAETILQTVAQEARWLLDFEHCSVVMREPHGYRTLILSGPGEVAGSDQPDWQPSPDIARVLRDGHPLRLGRLAEYQRPPGMASALIVPLRQAGQIIGTINFYSCAADHYTPSDLRIAYALALHVAAVLHNAELVAAAARARDELHTVLEAVSDGVLVCDRYGRVVLLNRAFHTMLNLTGHEVVGRPVVRLLRARFAEVVRLIRPAEARALADQWQCCQHDPVGGRVRLADGRTIEYGIAPLLQHETSVGYVLSARDVSAHEVVEQLRDDLLQMLVHDLRGPIGGLAMGIDLLAQWIQIGNIEQHQTTLHGMRLAIRCVLDRMNMILDMKKLEAGRLSLARSGCDLPTLLNQVIGALGPLQHERHRPITLIVPADLPRLWVDARLVQRVLEHMLSNACRFTPPNGRIVVEVTLADRSWLELWIDDQGPGVPEPLRTRIFEKYTDIPGMESLGGSGLGLSFCKLVVEAHGGEIGVAPGASDGSRFWFRLPISQQSALPAFTADGYVDQVPPLCHDSQTGTGASRQLA